MTFLFDNLPEQRAPQSTGSRPVSHRLDTPKHHPWPLQDGCNVVLFAGMGGTCQGAEEAGLPIHVAANHDEVAIAAHRALNPHTRHIQADIYEVDPLEATGGRYVSNLWASPDCTHHSSAKGGQPLSPRVRSMPWQICRWIGVLQKRGKGVGRMYLENVREIRSWGPLVAKRDKATGRVLKIDGTVAAKGERVPRFQQQLVRNRKEEGRTYRAWVKHIRGLRIAYEDRDLCCADYGIPTIRKRLFGVGHSSMALPSWPVVTHGHRNSEAVRAGILQPHVPAWKIIDWTRPMKSIFDRDKELVAATKKRVATGFMRFVYEAEKPFLIHLTHHGHRPAVDLDDPAPTFTGAHRGEMALVAGYMVQTGYGERAGQTPRCMSVDDALGTQVTNGGKHAVMTAWMVQHNTGVIGHPMEDGLSTMTTLGTQQNVATAYLIHQRGTSTATSIEDGLRSLTTGGNRGGDHVGVCMPFLHYQYSTGGKHSSIDAPLYAISTVDRAMVTGADAVMDDPPLPPELLAKAKRVADFLRAQGVWDGGDIVRIGPWIVIDICMRMLHFTEAAAAHELRLPETIRIQKRDRKGNAVLDPDGQPVWIERPLTKTEAFRLIGNSVPKRMAKLLISANSPMLFSEAAE